MKTRLLNTAHQVAMEQLAPKSNYSIIRLLAHVAEASCPTSEDFICTIAKSFLAPSYHSNPSLLAQKILSHSPSFQDAWGGIETNNLEVQIQLFRKRRDRSVAWKGRHKNSVKYKIIQHLKTHDHNSVLNAIAFTLEEIPPFTRTHPEQLAYQIYRETGQRITITRLKTKWLIKPRK